VGSIFDDIDRKYRQRKMQPSTCIRCESTSDLELRNIALTGQPEKRVLLCDQCEKFHQQTTAPRWFWAATGNAFHGDYCGSAPTREAAIADAIEKAKIDGADEITICFSEPYVFTDTPFSDYSNEILDRWRDEDNSDIADIFEVDTTSQQANDLEEMLNATFTAWRMKHRIGFCDVPNDMSKEETIEVGGEQDVE
jgi:hypothetical protein